MTKKIGGILSGVVTALLLVGCIAVPSLSVALLPAVCALLYYLSFFTGPWLFVAVAVPYSVPGLILHGANLFSIGGAVLLVSLTLPRLLRSRLSFAAEIGVAAAVAMVAVCVFAAVWAPCRGVSLEDAVPDAYAHADGDIAIVWCAEREYGRLGEEELGHPPLRAEDEQYEAEVLREYSYAVGRELDGYLLWYLSGFGAFCGGIAAVGAQAAAQCGRKGRPSRVADFRLYRGYLIVIAAALLFSVLGVMESLRPVTRTVFNLFITLPTALCGLTLLYHSLRRPPGKARIVTTVLFWVLAAAAALFYEWGLVILGFLGLADVILDVRKCLDWALGD